MDLDLAPDLFTPGIVIGFDMPIVQLLTLLVSDSNPDSDPKMLDSDSDSRKLRWIRIHVDSDSRQVDSDLDSDSRCPDSHITGANIPMDWIVLSADPGDGTGLVQRLSIHTQSAKEMCEMHLLDHKVTCCY